MLTPSALYKVVPHKRRSAWPPTEHGVNQKWLQKQSRSKSHNAELFVVTVLTFLSFANSLRLGKVQCRLCEKNENLRTNYGRFLRCFDGWCHVWTDINQLFFIFLSGTATVQMNLPYGIPTHVDLYSAAILRDFIHRIPYKKTRTLFLHSR